MAQLDDLLEDLVTANHVLARLGIVDSFGHISIRHPDRPDRFFLSCSRAPERVKRDDILHNHSPGVIPYGVTGHKLRPIMHMCATIGHDVPTWDQHKKFGDTDLLVRTMAQGRDQKARQRRHLPDARPRLCGGRPLDAPHRLYGDLSGAERKAADAGRGDAQEGALPHQGRSEQSHGNHVAAERQPRVGELVPHGR
jgi:hypothetical protein